MLRCACKVFDSMRQVSPPSVGLGVTSSVVGCAGLHSVAVTWPGECEWGVATSACG